MTRLLAALAIALLCCGAAYAAPQVQVGLDQLPDESTEAFYDRLFIQCGSWTELYAEVQLPAKEKLIALGIEPLKTLVPNFLGDGDIRHSVTLEEIIGAVGPEAAPVLIPHLAADGWLLRQRVCVALGGLDHPEVLPALTARLPLEESMDVLPSLIEAVGKRGAGASNLTEPLTPFLSHDDERLRRNTAVAFGRIGDPASITPLVLLLDDAYFSVRNPVRDALWKLISGPEPIALKGWDMETEVGRGLLIELQVGLMPTVWETVAHAPGALTPPEELPRHLATFQTIAAQVGLLRGVLRAWTKDHAQGDELFAVLPEHFDDPRLDAVLREIRASREAQLVREAAAAAVASPAP